MVDWGTVPDWVSGIGTTGALFATLYIVLSDRRAAEVQQARQIQLFGRQEFDAESGRVNGMNVGFRNGSGAAISNAIIAVKEHLASPQERVVFQAPPNQDWYLVEPGAMHWFGTIDFAQHGGINTEILLIFDDVHGKRWQVSFDRRDPEPFDLITVVRSKRSLMQRLRELRIR